MYLVAIEVASFIVAFLLFTASIWCMEIISDVQRSMFNIISLSSRYCIILFFVS